MARLLLIILLIAMQTPSLHARNNSPRSKTNMRNATQCEAGSGFACYNYGRALWNYGEKKEALHYLARGCDLKYKLSCESYHDHSVVTRRYRRKKAYADGTGEICFSNTELNNARFTPNPISKSGVSGQKIDMIKPNSFWDKSQLKENDIIVRMNNLPFNNQKESLRAFSASGKTFGFEVMRDGEKISLWYTCQ